MPATVHSSVLKPGWSTLPLAVWFLLALACEVARLFKAPPATDRMALPLHSGGSRWKCFDVLLMAGDLAGPKTWPLDGSPEVKFSLLLIPLLMLHHWHRQGAKGLNAGRWRSLQDF